MDKLRNSTHEVLRPSRAEPKPRRNDPSSEWDFSRMLIVMSVKPTLTDKLLKVNSALKLILSVIED